MKVLVTGGAGYVGSRVVTHLLRRGVSVTVLDRLIYGGEALLPFYDGEQFSFIHGDVRDRSALEKAMEGVEAIVHLAAIVGEPACSLNERATIEINRGAATACLAMAERLGVSRFVFLSTCSNYGVSDPNSLADEASELRPLSLYARTKVDVERECLSHRGRMTTTVLRLGTICGLSARMRFDLLVSEMARAAVRGDPISIYKPAAWRPFLHVADAGRVIDHVLRHETAGVANKVFNVVGGNFQKSDLMAIVHKHFPNARIVVTDAQPDNRDYRVNGERIARETGFSPAHTIEQAFVETAEAVRAGIFSDPMWPGYSALPLAERRILFERDN